MSEHPTEDLFTAAARLPVVIARKERETALDTLEARRAFYVREARAAALNLWIETGGKPVSVVDVRNVCPPPAEFDGRVMGAIFRECAGWTPTSDHIESGRRECHNRLVRTFVRIDG